MAKLVKLGGSATMFRDPETGFGLMEGEVKPWPDAPGALTRKWANAGGLVVFESADDRNGDGTMGQTRGSGPTEEGRTQGSAPTVDVANKIIEKRVEELMDQHTVAQLRAQLKEQGVAFHPREGERKLATKLAVAEWTARE